MHLIYHANKVSIMTVLASRAPPIHQCVQEHATTYAIGNPFEFM